MKTTNLLIVFASLAFLLPVSAAKVPSQLPDPDDKPADATKPVQVYILAGQSNMVGMGNLQGAKNIYNGVYFSSDPAVPDGPMTIYRVGSYRTAPLRIYLPDGTRHDESIAEGLLEVPQQGVYRFQCGFGENSYNRLQVDGTEVYQRQLGGSPIQTELRLAAGKRYPFKISGFQAEPPRFWLEKTDLLGNGDLEAVAKREGKFPWLVNSDGPWTVRKDVYFQEARIAKEGKGSPLSTNSNGKSIGPELGFGHVLGTFHDEQVLLIKTAMGNRALGFDFRPPSSGRTDPANNFESLEYKLMIDGVRKTLENINKVVPDYQNQGYEIAGFAWFQGHKDSFSEELINEYEKHLVNLINDVRKEFKTPDLPVVVATVGFGGRNMQDKFLRILAAQMAVGDAKQHPEYNGTVTSIDTRNFWRSVENSPANQDYHYNRNAETYMLIGDALGRAMVKLKGGQAEPLPLRAFPEEAKTTKVVELSEADQTRAQRALRPILIDGIATSYAANPRYQKSLLEEIRGERPKRANQFLRGSMYGLLNCYRAVGINDYDWHPFCPNLNQVQWNYYSFDPPEKLATDKGNRFREVTYPEAMANWIAPEFDADQIGWQKGVQPFGQMDGKLAAISENCTSAFCRCGETPRTLWENEVLLVRSTIKIPPLQEGHRYRIVVGGAAHVNSGEGFAVYANGKLLAQSTTGVAVRQGGQPRGAVIYNDVRDAFQTGKVTIAAISFLRYNHPRHGIQPPRGHLTLQIEEQKLPPIAAANKSQPE